MGGGEALRGTQKLIPEQLCEKSTFLDHFHSSFIHVFAHLFNTCSPKFPFTRTWDYSGEQAAAPQGAIILGQGSGEKTYKETRKYHVIHPTKRTRCFSFVLSFMPDLK